MRAYALEVLAEIRWHGGDVKVVAPNRLRVLAPPALLPKFVTRVQAVKPELLLALAEPKLPVDARAAEWQARHAESLAFWRAFHSTGEAACIAWGEMQFRWHRLHGSRVSTSICAGCGDRLDGAETLALGDGARLHIATLDRLVAYGQRWRGTATEALIHMGLAPPVKGEAA
jgi:hypothetical protein